MPKYDTYIQNLPEEDVIRYIRNRMSNKKIRERVLTAFSEANQKYDESLKEKKP